MYCYERFNSWLSKRALNRFRPEATIMETYRVRTFVAFVCITTKLNLHRFLNGVNLCRCVKKMINLNVYSVMNLHLLLGTYVANYHIHYKHACMFIHLYI